MKRFFSLILTICMFFSLAACSSSEKKDAFSPGTIPSPSAVPSAPDPEPVPAEEDFTEPEDPPEPELTEFDVTYDRFPGSVFLEDDRFRATAHTFGIGTYADLETIDSMFHDFPEEVSQWMESLADIPSLEFDFTVENLTSEKVDIQELQRDKKGISLSVNEVPIPEDAWICYGFSYDPSNIIGDSLAKSPYILPGSVASFSLFIRADPARLKKWTGKPYVERLALSDSILDPGTFLLDIHPSSPCSAEERARLLTYAIWSFDNKITDLADFPEEARSVIRKEMEDISRIIRVSETTFHPNALKETVDWGDGKIMLPLVDLELSNSSEEIAYDTGLWNIEINGIPANPEVYVSLTLLPGSTDTITLYLSRDEFNALGIKLKKITSITAEVDLTPCYPDLKNRVLLFCNDELLTIENALNYSKE